MEAGKPTNLPPFSSLPYDVIVNILKNLPVKILLRFRCVCKDWNSIITSQSFINTHLISQPLGHLFAHYSEPSVLSSSTSHKTQFCSFVPDESFSLVNKFKIPLPCSSQQESYHILVGSFDGLLCLTDLKPFGRELYMWNPSIRKYKTLPDSCLFNGTDRQRFFHLTSTVGLGFGFRVYTGDHIIIRIAIFESRRRRSKSDPLPQAEVYSLSTDSWKKVGFSEDVWKRLMNIWPRKSVNLNGDLSWMAMFSDGQGRTYNSILSFDVNEEAFREVRLPSDFKNGIHNITMQLEVYRGSLAVISFGDPRSHDAHTIWLWVMEEYGKVDSWRKRTPVKTTEQRSFHGCTLDGRIVLGRCCGNGGRLELFDMETLQEQRLCIPSIQSVHTFKESLVSFQGANVLSY